MSKEYMFRIGLLFMAMLSLSLSAHPSGLVSVGLLAFDGVFIAKATLFAAMVLAGTLIIGSFLTRTLRMPSVASYIIAGIILGPSMLNIASWGIFCNEQVVGHTASELILFFIQMICSFLTVPLLMWMAGHETDMAHIKKVSTIALVGGSLGAVLPVVFIGFALWGWGMAVQGACAIGLIFAATSVSIPVAMLVSLKKMHTKPAQATLGAAVVDDIVAVIFLSLFSVLFATRGSHSGSLFFVITWLVVGLSLLIVLGRWFMPLVMRRVQGSSDIVTALGFVHMWGFAAIAELVSGLAGITGAYFAGYFHKHADSEHRVLHAIQSVACAVLLPLYLGSIGLAINIFTLSMTQWIWVVLIVVLAVISKLLACYCAVGVANWVHSDRWTFLESSLFGASMVARGEVGLVIAGSMHAAGLLDAAWYGSSVIGITVTTILAPILLDHLFTYQEKHTGYHARLGIAWNRQELDELIQYLAHRGHKAIVQGNQTVHVSGARVTFIIEHNEVTSEQKERSLTAVYQALVQKE